jgi:hypothetical protein
VLSRVELSVRHCPGQPFQIWGRGAVLGVRGSVDEVLTLADGTMAPFDYKFAEAPRSVYHNQKMQSALYGLLISEGVLGSREQRRNEGMHAHGRTHCRRYQPMQVAAHAFTICR